MVGAAYAAVAKRPAAASALLKNMVERMCVYVLCVYIYTVKKKGTGHEVCTEAEKTSVLLLMMMR
jgi:hypothetical protein